MAHVYLKYFSAAGPLDILPQEHVVALGKAPQEAAEEANGRTWVTWKRDRVLMAGKLSVRVMVKESIQQGNEWIREEEKAEESTKRFLEEGLNLRECGFSLPTSLKMFSFDN